jgi:ferredoxin-like protein FixX
MEFKIVVDYYPGETGEFIKVIEENCKGCGKCADVCAVGVWEQDGTVYRPTRLKRCAECGACWNICEADAIHFSEPAGGTGVSFAYG